MLCINKKRKSVEECPPHSQLSVMGNGNHTTPSNGNRRLVTYIDSVQKSRFLLWKPEADFSSPSHIQLNRRHRGELQLAIVHTRGTLRGVNRHIESALLVIRESHLNFNEVPLLYDRGNIPTCRRRRGVWSPRIQSKSVEVVGRSLRSRRGCCRRRGRTLKPTITARRNEGRHEGDQKRRKQTKRHDCLLSPKGP